MPDYRSLIAPFINFRRAFIKADSTLRKDNLTLHKSIDFLEHGHFDAPNEAYFEALEAHFLQSLAKSTTDSKITLTRKFFTWTQKGDSHMQEEIQITNTENGEAFSESEAHSNEKAPSLNFTEEHEETLTDRGAVSTENTPSNPTVDADTKKPMPPHKGEKKHTSKQRKLTVYPDKALEADIRDLAALDGKPVSKFILNLIQQEVDNRREDLNIIRSIRAKRA